MGQAQSHVAKSTRFLHRRKPETASREQSQENSMQSSSPPPEADGSSAQIDHPSPHAAQSSTTANIAPTPDSPQADSHGESMTGTPDEDGDDVEKQTSHAPDGPIVKKPTQQDVDKPTTSRPAIKREYTPPHRVRIETYTAWRTENIFGNLHVHIREQQMESTRGGAAAQLENFIYQAADRCTMALEYLVSHFSTRFFDHAGPENLVSMMTMIETDACALDDLLPRQLNFSNHGYAIEMKLIQMQSHIEDLAEVAKRIREDGVRVEEDEEADADRDTDPDAKGEKDHGDDMNC
ncbi:hypothetical protein J7T55_002867 [Diaporthe amygdali]|uniref:uncharacterized protein n=1 Tax=Phomopsis amygdali TaxID=1214568 RepID=UPI0022FDF0FF|nr:uncharacterized protein J7T55_002867 [Diaporthe amygdali]KAJ0122354.1 hypothetical protein J7T55_002867 [Diaporthe amygdali]